MIKKIRSVWYALWSLRENTEVIPCMGWNGAQLHSWLILVMEAGEWSTTFPGRFTPGKEHTVHIE